jgi:ribosome biogenesis GTPase / thiamine phosphate phosphatase
LSLTSLGWDTSFADLFRPFESAGLVPARVAVRHHGPCTLLTGRGALGGVPVGRLSEEELPAVGDWVAARPLPGERRALIEAVLPRRTVFLRKEAWRRTAAQVLAANVDVAFLVSAFGLDLNLRRIERYLTLARDSGAEPVIVLTKADRAPQPAHAVGDVDAVAGGAPVVVTSSVTGRGLEEVRAHLGAGRTGAFLGSSGVGKSTLANRLLGRQHFPTRELRGNERGRHTTVRRELVLLPTGGLVIDTPGLREVQLWAREDALESSFADITGLAARCRFRDCSHAVEPDCAVLAAVAAGALAGERLAGYRKLRRELRALDVRRRGRVKARGTPAGPGSRRRRR